MDFNKSKTALADSLFSLDIKPSKAKFQGYKQPVYDMQALNPYAEGQWLKLEPQVFTSTLEPGKEEETETGEDSVIEEEDEVTENKDHRYKKNNILRGPIWNYGLRKLSCDKDYFDNVLFGVPWKSLMTPEHMISRGTKWSATKPITRSLAAFILRKLKKMDPEKTALVELETNRTLSYRMFAEKAESLACGLHWLGVQPLQIIGIVSFNSLEAHLMILACLLIGAVVALIDSSLSAVELGIVLRSTGPRMLFTEVGKTLYKVEMAISYLELSLHSPKPQIIINSTTMEKSTRYFLFYQLLKEVDPIERIPGPRRADPLRPIMILYTGRSDDPKACVISERYFTLSKAFVESVLPNSDEPSITVMITPPMYCAMAIKQVLNNLIDGHRIVLCRGNIPEPSFITALRKFEVFAILTTQIMLMSLLNWGVRPRCAHLKMVAVTGVPLRLKNLLRVHNELFRGKVQILQLYGLVETGTIASNTFLENKYGSVGKLYYNVEMKVLEEGTKVPLGINQEGELCVRTPIMMLEYHNNPVANKETIDSEGFIHTGDLGYYDEKGFVHVTDHVREIIKWRTYLVSPSLVEEVLMEQPEIREALVFGLINYENGELVTAAVIFEFEHEHTDIEALEKRVNDLLPYHRRIRGGIHTFHQFPRSSLGKPLKESILKELLERKNIISYRRPSERLDTV